MNIRKYSPPQHCSILRVILLAGCSCGAAWVVNVAQSATSPHTEGSSQRIIAGSGFSIPWHTVGGGGGTSSGDGFVLGGTAGQPNAGTLAGGTYELYGGFWVSLPEPGIPQDLTGDGVVNAADLAQLLGAWGMIEPCPPTVAADFNGDCQVNAADLASLLGAWE